MADADCDQFHKWLYFYTFTCIRTVVSLRMDTQFDFDVKTNDATHTTRGYEKMYHLNNEKFKGEQSMSSLFIQTWLRESRKTI